jgi:hypothetical protein
MPFLFFGLQTQNIAGKIKRILPSIAHAERQPGRYRICRAIGGNFFMKLHTQRKCDAAT